MKILDTTKKIIVVIGMLFFILLFTGFSIRNTKAISSSFGEATIMVYGLGLLFGCLFSMLKVILLDRTLNKAMNLASSNAQNYALIQYLIRYLLTGVILIISALNNNIDFFGAIIGILTMQLASYIVGFTIKDDESFKKEMKIKKENTFSKMKDEFN